MKIKLFLSHKSYLMKIITYFLILTSIIVIVLSSILYMNFKSIGISLVNSSVLDKLAQTSYSSNFLKEYSKGSILQIYFDSSVIMSLNKYSIDDIEANSIIEKLSRIVNSSDFIHSISVYSGASNQLISTKSFLGTSEKIFLLNYVDTLVKNKETGNKLTPILRRITDPDDFHQGTKRDIPVYTYIMYDYSEINKLPSTAVIINVKEEWIKNVMKSMNQNSLGNTFIIDNNGTIVSHDSSIMFLKNISEEEYIKLILKSKLDSGNFISNIDNEKCLVTYVSSKKLGWKFVSVLPFNSIMGKVITMEKYTLFISIGILILGLFVSFTLSKNMYSPIGNLKKLLLPFSSLVTGEVKNEMQLILEGTNEAISRARSYEVLKKEKDVNIKESTLKEFLFFDKTLLSENLKDNRFEQKIKDLKFNIDLSQPSTVILLKIDNFCQFTKEYNLSDRSLFKFAIANIANEILLEKYRNEPVDAGDDHIALILNVQVMSDENLLEDLSIYLRKLQQLIQEYLKISVTALVGITCNNLGDIDLSYKNALNLSEYRIKYGHQSILTYKMLDNSNQIDLVIPEKKINLLQDSLKLGRLTQTEQIYNELISSALESNINYLNTIIMNIAIALSNTANTLVKFAYSEPLINLNTLIKTLNSMETIDQVNSIFYELFKKIVNTSDSKRNNKSNNLIDSVIERIKKDYPNCNLSLDSIADSEGMSSVYLGRIFKEHTSKSVAEYMNQVRVAQSMELLSQSSLPVNEIVEKVGFNSVPHFYTVFKKSLGLTPNEYRKNSNTYGLIKY